MNVMFKYDDLMDALTRAEIRVKEEIVEDQTFRIVCYMVATPDLWDVKNAIECRGITFDSDGNCVVRPFEKFFNINENKYTQLYDLDFTNAVAYEKIDGSMVTPLFVNGNLYMKTKKSFYSDVAVSSTKFARNNQSISFLCKLTQSKNLTPIFEYQSPEHMIVINTETEKLTLLAIRDNQTGEYLTDSQIDQIINIVADATGDRVHVPDMEPANIDDLLQQVETKVDFEGWVIRLSNGKRVKLKTKDYLLRHKSTNFNERDIAELVANEKLDDVLPTLKLNDIQLEKINQIAQNVALEFQRMDTRVKEILSEINDKQIPRNLIYSTYKDEPLIGLVFASLNGKDPDFLKSWNSLYKDKYSTTKMFLV